MVDSRKYVRAAPVGASLLAKAVCQPTLLLDLKPPSRAGSLPQGGTINRATKSPLGRRCQPAPGLRIR
ncbi:hypothetical protein DM828_24830 [Pseudomonas umsongensis]|nr:hypothetical protein [Pseudomonas umsongensis]